MTEYRKPSESELRKRLTPTQFQVTQHEGTERPFQNEYWDNHEAGIHVDVVSGEPLFSSLDKYESGTGWPSFTKPLVAENITTKTDRSLFTTRTEARSKHADSHSGTSSTTVRSRPAALLHELGVVAVHPCLEARRGGIRRVPAVVRAGGRAE